MITAKRLIMSVLSQEPAESKTDEDAVNYPKRNAHQNFLFTKWKRGIVFILSVFIIGQLFSFGIHVSMKKWEIDGIVEEITGENLANVVRWLGSEGRAWSVFLDESGLKDTVYNAVGVIKSEVEEIIDPFC